MNVTLPGLLCCAFVVIAGCSDTATAPTPGATEIQSVAALPNPENALSTLIVIATRNADSARVVYRVENGIDVGTRFIPVKQELDTIAVVGLRPDTRYSYMVEAAGAA